MKTLSQIPRKISAKFCYDIDKLGQSENIESTDFVPYTFEDSNDTQDNSPKLTEEQQSRIDAQELAKIDVELNLEDSALKEKDVAADVATEIPVRIITNSELKKSYDGAPAATIASIENSDIFRRMIGSSNLKDWR